VTASTHAGPTEFAWSCCGVGPRDLRSLAAPVSRSSPYQPRPNASWLRDSRGSVQRTTQLETDHGKRSAFCPRRPKLWEWNLGPSHGHYGPTRLIGDEDNFLLSTLFTSRHTHINTHTQAPSRSPQPRSTHLRNMVSSLNGQIASNGTNGTNGHSAASEYVKPSTKLRQLLAEPGCVPAPGVYDGISARLALEAGFPCLVSGLLFYRRHTPLCRRKVQVVGCRMPYF
jgi:hypothetical protein